ncbi:MAG: hypothetical protein G01um101418_81 [Parcubacteria group bacterium Gr01-1014_18]|nr:MAG: hypothetical protein Greene041636_81 [Parcubacteria group bacterium Greene0416_36]TSC81587.1 MAG: hypothetical protein G01um101418_81 [Parcubacteria group bacterium Gr01-1014_18]TSC99601.1 MAG: hypothetical protein Greene101420_5 [Parcubacteria group bacterium Greene1014_20]TSD06004.1 MAG: hypothetical protein Greene07142_968 [Parcubacteria group bacterium Greene0714_2]
MTDHEILKILLDTQEWQTFDCKRAAIKPHDLLETVVAFANTEGGTIVVGLEDPEKAEKGKRLLGVSENLDNVSDFLKLIDKEIDPHILWTKGEIDIINIHNQPDKLIIFNISKSNDVHSLKKGDTFVRKGRQNMKIGSSEIMRLMYEKGSIKFENEKSGIKNLEDLDQNLLDEYKKDTGSQSQDNWQFLKDNGFSDVSGEHELTKAGVLLFGKNPTVLLRSKCGVKISHYFGTEPNYSGEPNFVERPFSIEGPLIQQIEKTVQYFRLVVMKSSPKLRGASFEPSFMIPEWAFQEAITNAVVHRNYSLQDDIQVRFFDNRVEVESPGTYPGSITIENIRNNRFSRNPVIVRTLNRFKTAPNLDIGEGVDRMFRVMKDQNLYEPQYISPAIRPFSVLLLLLNLRRVEYWDTVSKFLDENFQITNIQAREITGIHDVLKMSKLLGVWTKAGLLEKISLSEKAKKEVYYKKKGKFIQGRLLSRGEIIESEK